MNTVNEDLIAEVRDALANLDGKWFPEAGAREFDAAAPGLMRRLLNLTEAQRAEINHLRDKLATGKRGEKLYASAFEWAANFEYEGCYCGAPEIISPCSYCCP